MAMKYLILIIFKDTHDVISEDVNCDLSKESIACIKGLLSHLHQHICHFFPCCFHCFAIVTTVHYDFFFMHSAAPHHAQENTLG